MDRINFAPKIGAPPIADALKRTRENGEGDKGVARVKFPSEVPIVDWLNFLRAERSLEIQGRRRFVKSGRIAHLPRKGSSSSSRFIPLSLLSSLTCGRSEIRNDLSALSAHGGSVRPTH